MKRTALAANPAEIITRKVAVSFSEDPADTLHATVRVMGLSPETQAAIMSPDALTTDMDGARRLFAQALHELVVETDLEEEDGTPTSFAVEDLAQWPLADLVTITFRLVEAVRGVPFETSTPSAG